MLSARAGNADDKYLGMIDLHCLLTHYYSLMHTGNAAAAALASCCWRFGCLNASTKAIASDLDLVRCRDETSRIVIQSYA
jgi:hypothetical protein